MNRLAGFLPIDFADCCQRENDSEWKNDPCLADSKSISTEESQHVGQNGTNDAAREFGLHSLHAVGEYIIGGAETDRGASRHYEPLREIERPLKSALQNVAIQQERRND